MPADTQRTWRDARRVLAVRLDNIGDVVMLGPALRSIRTALPESEITLMASPAGSQVAPLLPSIDRVLTRRVVWQDASGALPLDPARELALVDEIRAHRYDAAFIFTSFSQTPYPPAYVCYLAGIPLRAGMARDFGGSLLTDWVKPLPDDAHQVDRNLFLIESLGFEVAGRDLELHVSEKIEGQVDAMLREAGIGPTGRYILLAPGASCPARRYDIGRFAEVALRLMSETGMPLVLIGSERERELVQPIIDAAEGMRLVSLVGRTSIPQMAGVIRRSSLVLANDSGPMHMADAFMRPMVVLYSGTEYESQWRPRYAPTALLRRPTPCSPCYSFECPFSMECLDIPPSEVVEHALKLLAQEAFA